MPRIRETLQELAGELLEQGKQLQRLADLVGQAEHWDLLQEGVLVAAIEVWNTSSDLNNLANEVGQGKSRP